MTSQLTKREARRAFNEGVRAGFSPGTWCWYGNPERQRWYQAGKLWAQDRRKAGLSMFEAQWIRERRQR